MLWSQPTQLMLLVLVVFTVNVSAQELSSTLHTTITGVLVAYEGEIVTFTCVTRNSQTIGWSGDDYVGAGGSRLEFTLFDPLQTPRPTSTGRANATLLSVDRSMPERPILVSQLQIRVVSTFQTSSVTCHSVGTDETSTTTFYMADVISVTCNQLSVCPTKPVICTCVTGYSMMHYWISDDYIGRSNQLEFTSSDSVDTRRNATVSSASAVLVNISNENDIFVITSNLTVIAERSDVPVVLTCVNVDRQNTTVFLPVADDCRGPPSNLVATTAPASGGAGSVSDETYIAPLILLILAIILLAALVIIFIFVFKREKESLKQKCEEELQRKDEEFKNEKKKLEEKCEEELRRKDEEIDGLQTECTKKDEKIKDLRTVVEEKDEEIKNSKKKNDELTQANRKLRESKKNLEEKLRSNTKEISELSVASVEDNHMIKSLKQKLADANTKIDQLKAQVKEVGRRPPPAGV